MSAAAARTPPEAVSATVDKDIIGLTGEFSLSNALPLLKKSEEWFTGAKTLSIDLSGIRRSDSSGAALMLEWKRQARRAGGDIRFLNVPAQLRSILEFCGLGQVISLAA